MKTILLSILLSVAVLTARADMNEISEQLDRVSVTVHCADGTGSGVIINRDGNTYVLTAGHVVAANRKTRSAIKDGSVKIETDYQDLSVLTQVIEQGRIVGSASYDAEVIAYSSADYGDDVAVLKLRKQGAFADTTKFSKEDHVPPGTELYHVGSMGGDFGANSFTTGVLARTGRLIEGKVYDQTTVTAFPGSSGGGVFTTKGEYIGMLVRGGIVGTFNFITPLRRLKQWAASAHVEFIFDASKPIEKDNIILEKDEAPSFMDINLRLKSKTDIAPIPLAK
jgi:S1-C subfamily serine protease